MVSCQGVLPQSRRKSVKQRREVRRNSTDDQELRELGFKSPADLQESTSSSSSAEVGSHHHFYHCIFTMILVLLDMIYSDSRKYC